jgi:hypothetical protein
MVRIPSPCPWSVNPRQPGTMIESSTSEPTYDDNQASSTAVSSVAGAHDSLPYPHPPVTFDTGPYKGLVLRAELREIQAGKIGRK